MKIPTNPSNCAPGIPAPVRRVLRQETLISTLINSLVPAAVIWWLDLAAPQRLLGDESVLQSMVPAALLATGVMTLVLTLILRRRARAGAVPTLANAQAMGAIHRHIPKNLLLRALAFAVCAGLVLIPAGLAVVALLGLVPLSKLGFLVHNLLFGAAVGLLMTRWVVLAALADPA